MSISNNPNPDINRLAESAMQKMQESKESISERSTSTSNYLSHSVSLREKASPSEQKLDAVSEETFDIIDYHGKTLHEMGFREISIIEEPPFSEEDWMMSGPGYSEVQAKPRKEKPDAAVLEGLKAAIAKYDLEYPEMQKVSTKTLPELPLLKQTDKLLKDIENPALSEQKTQNLNKLDQLKQKLESRKSEASNTFAGQQRISDYDGQTKTKLTPNMKSPSVLNSEIAQLDAEIKKIDDFQHQPPSVQTAKKGLPSIPAKSVPEPMQPQASIQPEEVSQPEVQTTKRRGLIPTQTIINDIKANLAIDRSTLSPEDLKTADALLGSLKVVIQGRLEQLKQDTSSRDIEKIFENSKNITKLNDTLNEIEEFQSNPPSTATKPLPQESKPVKMRGVLSPSTPTAAQELPNETVERPVEAESPDGGSAADAPSETQGTLGSMTEEPQVSRRQPGKTAELYGAGSRGAFKKHDISGEVRGNLDAEGLKAAFSKYEKEQAPVEESEVSMLEPTATQPKSIAQENFEKSLLGRPYNELRMTEPNFLYGANQSNSINTALLRLRALNASQPGSAEFEIKKKFQEKNIDLEKLIGNFASILESGNEFSKKLTSIYENSDVNNKARDLESLFFNEFEEHVNNITNAALMYDRINVLDPTFSNSYIVPVQRLPRYVMTLEEIQARTENPVDKERLSGPIALARAYTTKFNEAQWRKESLSPPIVENSKLSQPKLQRMRNISFSVRKAILTRSLIPLSQTVSDYKLSKAKTEIEQSEKYKTLLSFKGEGSNRSNFASRLKGLQEEIRNIQLKFGDSVHGHELVEPLMTNLTELGKARMVIKPYEMQGFILGDDLGDPQLLKMFRENLDRWVGKPNDFENLLNQVMENGLSENEGTRYGQVRSLQQFALNAAELYRINENNVSKLPEGLRTSMEKLIALGEPLNPVTENALREAIKDRAY